MEKIKVWDCSDVFVGQYPFHQKLKDELVPILEEYPDQMGRMTNVKATMTEWQWDPRSGNLNRVKDCILSEIRTHMEYGYIGRPKPFLEFEHFWGNVYRKGDYTQSHTHRNSWFSVVYFLKTKWYHPSLIFTDSGKRIRSKEGSYVIFPSYLKHYVPKHRFDETRITLSGNVNYKGLTFDDGVR